MREATMKAKKEQVNQIKDKLSESSSSVIVEYRGLSVQKVTELRSLLREENVEFKVYKNTMVSRAADAAGLNDLNEYLTGPNAIAFSDDAVAPSRILAKFAKKNRKLIRKQNTFIFHITTSKNFHTVKTVFYPPIATKFCPIT